MVENVSWNPLATKKAIAVQEAVQATEVVRAARYVLWLTGKRPTIKKLAETSGISRFVINELFRREGMLTNPLPRVNKDLLPDNQYAFFLGLSYGVYPIKQVPWSKHKYITVITASKDPKKHALLDVFEEWGEVHHNGRNSEKERLETTAYLSPQNFSFLKENRSPGSAILLSKAKFPPFILGVIAGGLREQTGRLPLEESLRLSMMRNFENQFGFPLGAEKKDNSHGRKLTVLYVTDLGRVMDALFKEESVKRLPFGQTVRELILPTAA